MEQRHTSLTLSLSTYPFMSKYDHPFDETAATDNAFADRPHQNRTT